MILIFRKSKSDQSLCNQNNFDFNRFPCRKFFYESGVLLHRKIVKGKDS